MLPKSRALLWDMQQSAEFILEVSIGMDARILESDQLSRSAIERNFEILGEAARRLLDSDPEVASRLTGVRAVVGLRNIIAHGYDRIDYELLWQAIEVHLPILHTQVSELLESSV